MQHPVVKRGPCYHPYSRCFHEDLASILCKAHLHTPVQTQKKMLYTVLLLRSLAHLVFSQLVSVWTGIFLYTPVFTNKTEHYFVCLNVDVLPFCCTNTPADVRATSLHRQKPTNVVSSIPTSTLPSVGAVQFSLLRANLRKVPATYCLYAGTWTCGANYLNNPRPRASSMQLWIILTFL